MRVQEISGKEHESTLLLQKTRSGVSGGVQGVPGGGSREGGVRKNGLKHENQKNAPELYGELTTQPQAKWLRVPPFGACPPCSKEG